MPKVEIYYFMLRDSKAGENRRSPRPATLEAIQRRGGKAILETRRVVDSTDLDGNEDLKREIT